MRFPNTVDDFIALLDRTFPEVVPQPGDSPEEIMHAAGARSVVAWSKAARANASKTPAPPRLRGRGRDVRSK
jgi:hypothetical protein